MNGRRRILLAMAGAVVLAVTGVFPAGAAVEVSRWEPGQPTFTAAEQSPPIVGVNYHGLWDDMTAQRRGAVLDALAATGASWVRLDVAWSMLQPDGPGGYDMGWGVPRLDTVLDEIHARGLQTLLMFYWAPSWATGTSNKNGVPRDPQKYADAAAWVADRWRDRVGAIEIWNEPDLERFLANTSVETYTALVKAAYKSIKAVNPQMTVVAGAPTYVKTDWYREFYRLGGAGHYDALGVHPYIGTSDAPPDACDPNWRQYYPCNVATLVQLMADNGDADKAIWATEYGWSAHDGRTYGSTPPTWKRGVTLTQQAQYLLDMQETLATWPQVHATFWYTDVDTAVGDQMEDNFGLLTRTLTPKPAYYALRCAAATICGPDDPSGPAEPDAGPPPSVSDPLALVPAGSGWRFVDDGVEPAAGWAGVDFNDSGWRSGPAKLGYGEGDEATLVYPGSSGSPGRLAYYARTAFDVADASRVEELTLRLLIDDGAVAYINGQEVGRLNLPSGTITASTPALRYIAGDQESAWTEIDIPTDLLRTGSNVLAVEVHNHSRTSSDMSLDAELVANP